MQYRLSRRKWWLSAALVVVLVLAGSVGWYLSRTHTPPLATVIAVPYAQTNRAELLQLTNAVRTKNGLSELTASATLDQAAQAKANDMIAKNYWGHLGPDQTNPWDWLNQARYDYIRAGENLAYGFSDNTKLVDGWLASPEHRANLLGNYGYVGFGLARGRQYQGGDNTVVVAFYATPR
ncbi:MAG TPA: CAP domain-containing protein [Candidatus Saccharimonadales bacterium]|jgi:uncharacterized protein YkwD|nr:CAP domain-containing protein [Candidatus Saccharimonadales bacterium]